MTGKKNKWMHRTLCAAIAVTLAAGTAVMTPAFDFAGVPTGIVAHAASYTYDYNTDNTPFYSGRFTKTNSYTLKFPNTYQGNLCWSGVVNTYGNDEDNEPNPTNYAAGLTATIDTNGNLTMNGRTYSLGSGYNAWCLCYYIADWTGYYYWFFCRTNVSASVSTAPTAKTDLTYTGNAQDLVNAGTANNGIMNYSLDNQSFSADIPTGTDAGSYTVYYKAVGTNGYNDSGVRNVNVTIDKGTPTVTAPTAKTDLIENGNAQELVNAGSTTGGTLQYSLDNQNFSTDIPTGTDANTYRVYYKVVGDNNYLDVDSQYVDVTIERLEKIDISTAKLIANPLVFAYDGEEHTVSAVLKLNGQKLTKDVDYVLTGNTATEPGTYTLAAEGIGNYQGTVYATWRICNVYFVTATIDGVTTYTSYEDKSLVKFTSSGNGAWYINDVLTSTKNELSFTILRDSVVEWRADETQEQIAIANSAISARTKNGDKDRVTITATWSLPEGAVVTQAGTARCYATGETPDKETVYNNGTKKNSTLKTLNGTFEFNLNMGATSAAKTLCVVTYVTYTLNGQEYTVISEVATSAPQNA